MQTLPAGAWSATLGGGQQWYQFEGSTSPSALTITGDRDIYIRVRQGQKLYLSKIARDEDAADVQIFVLLEEGESGPGGVFQTEYGFENPDNAPLYICGGADTKVSLGGATELTGSIYCAGEVATGSKTCLLYTSPSPQLVEHRAQQLCESVAACEDFPTSISVGVALWPQDGSDYDELLHAADQALYTAKGAGKNRVAFSQNLGESG